MAKLDQIKTLLIVFTSFTLCLGAVWLTQFIDNQTGVKYEELTTLLFSVLWSLQGTVDCLAWFASQRKLLQIIWKRTISDYDVLLHDDEEEVFSDISEALRSIALIALYNNPT